MIKQLTTKLITKQTILNTHRSIANFAQDWSHVYDGIFRFEDNTLGEGVLAIREQALTFAKTKLSPFAMEW